MKRIYPTYPIHNWPALALWVCGAILTSSACQNAVASALSLAQLENLNAIALWLGIARMEKHYS